MTLNNLQWAKKNLAQPKASKKLHEKIHREQKLQHYVNLRANVNLNKFENLFFNLIWWAKYNQHSVAFQCDEIKTTKQIIFKALNVLSMSKFDFLNLIHKVDLCIANVNLRVSKWFATYPLMFQRNPFSTQHLITIIRSLLHGESWWK